MWIKNRNMHMAVTLPRFVTEERELSNGKMETVRIPTASFTPAQWDARGYNRAVQATRSDYATCETAWIKG
ncbi:hypothetical protein [Pseudodesulfovibrio sp.]|uniref:hypothetical protein n=1 Tax=unclassified Pseudodesulfovibrio TaxID=2661612 RepID=UPI003B00B6F2